MKSLLYFLKNRFSTILFSILVFNSFFLIYSCKTPDSNNEIEEDNNNEIEEDNNQNPKTNNSKPGNEQPTDQNQENNNKNLNNGQPTDQNQENNNKNSNNEQPTDQNQENNNQNLNNEQNSNGCIHGNIDLANEFKNILSEEMLNLMPHLSNLALNYNLVNLDPMALMTGNAGILLNNILQLGVSLMSLGANFSIILKYINPPDNKKEEFYYRILLAMNDNKISIIDLLKDPEEYANNNSNKIKAFIKNLFDNKTLETSGAPLLKLISNNNNKQKYLNTFTDNFIKDLFKILNVGYKGFKNNKRVKEITSNIQNISFNQMPNEKEAIGQMSKFINKQHQNCEIIPGIFKNPQIANVLPIQNFRCVDENDEDWIKKLINSMCGFSSVLMAAQNEGMNISKKKVCKMAYNFCKFPNEIVDIEQKVSKTFFNKALGDLDPKEKELLNIIVPIMYMIIKELVTPQMGVLRPSKFFSNYKLNGFKLKPEITFSNRNSITNYLNNLKPGEKRIILTYLEKSMHFYIIEKLSDGRFKTSDPDFDKNSLNENFKNPNIKDINQIISEMELDINKLKGSIQQCIEDYKNQLSSNLKNIDVTNLISGLLGINKEELLNRLAINIKDIIQDNIGQKQIYLLCEYEINK